VTASYDFFDAAVRDDPFPLFARLRRHDPVYRTDFGYWYVSRYADASALLRDPRLGPGRGVPDSFGITDGPLHDLMTSWLMALDGPAHTRVRRLISRSFTPRSVEALRPAVEEVSGRLAGRLVAAGGGDIVADLAFPLPMEVVRMLFGVDRHEWEAEVVALFDPRRTREEGFVGLMQQLAGYFWRLVPARRAAPGDDLFSAMVRPDDSGECLTDLELVANAVLLVTAGFETTMGLVSLAVLTLLRHPDQLALLRETPGFVRNAVDEVLRFEPAALSTTRHTPVELVVAGTTIPAGSNILFSMVAANRDPERYADPDRFDVTRTDIRPLTFGGGAHACIGAALARLEAEVAVGDLLARTDRLSLVTEPIAWQADNPTVRRPEQLVVSCTASPPGVT
jgi:cytochrome P450